MDSAIMTNQDFSGVGGDLYFGDGEQPDWRKGDPDDEIDDDDDPAPIATVLLTEMLGIDPADLDEFDEEDEDIEDDDDEDLSDIDIDIEDEDDA
jgi:hypothetical protein